MERLSIDPRPPIHQGVDLNNFTVLQHTAIHDILLSHITPGTGNVYISINPYGTAPLSGYVGVWAVTTNPIQIHIIDDLGSIPIDYNYTPALGANLIPLVGLSPGAANELHITIPGVGTSSGFILTPPLPPTDAEIPPNPSSNRFTGFPVCEVTIESTDLPDIITELYFVAFARRYNVGLDCTGRVRWYTTLDIPSFNIERISNGHFLSNSFDFDAHKLIYEYDLVGRVHKVYVLDNQSHHSIYQLPDENLLINSEFDGVTEEDGLSIIDFNTGLEIAYYDMRNVMDTNRPPVPRIISSLGIDWLHINQSYLNQSNNLLITSGRHQGVFAVDVNTSELVFILGNHQDWNAQFNGYLLTPVDMTGTPLYDLSDPVDIDRADKEFWQWGQHAVIEVPNPVHGIVEFLLLDNGNFRSRDESKAILPNDNYTRIVQYRVNISNMTVMKIFEYGQEIGSRGYSPFVSNGAILNNGNYFMNSGGIVFDENYRQRTIDPGYGDIIDPLMGNMAQGRIIIQEIDPVAKKPILEFTCTSGRFKSPNLDDPDFIQYDLYCFRAHKLPLLP